MSQSPSLLLFLHKRKCSVQSWLRRHKHHWNSKAALRKRTPQLVCKWCFLALNTLWTCSMLICHAIISTRWNSRQCMSHQTSGRCINVPALFFFFPSPPPSLLQPLSCVPRLAHFVASVTCSRSTVLQGCLIFTRWCQASFQSFLSQKVKATRRVRLCLLKGTEYKR